MWAPQDDPFQTNNDPERLLAWGRQVILRETPKMAHDQSATGRLAAPPAPIAKLTLVITGLAAAIVVTLALPHG